MPLDPEIAAHLKREAAMPPRASLTIEQSRQRMLAAQALSEQTDPLAREEDLMVADVPVRQYWPVYDPSLPLVVFLHGGRFFSGCIESHAPLCRLLAVFSGARVLAVEYRLAPEHPYPAAVEDSLTATDGAFEQAERVAICGDSVGACLASIVALERPALACQALWYPMLDPTCSSPSHREFATGYGPGSDDMKRGWELYAPEPAAEPRLSPLYAQDLHGAPPTLMITAEYDTLRDEGEGYAHRLRTAGVDVTLHRVDGAIHGFATFSAFSRLARMTVVEVGEYLADHLRGENR
jgi:acetyl esterase